MIRWNSNIPFVKTFLLRLLFVAFVSSQLISYVGFPMLRTILPAEEPETGERMCTSTGLAVKKYLNIHSVAQALI